MSAHYAPGVDPAFLVIAEGIEDQETLEVLRELKCGFGQGFHLGLPMGITDFAKLQAQKTPAC